jgi:histidine triad (HIT) family protein
MLHLARSPLGGLLVGWLFEYMSFAIPVHRLRETSTLVAFEQPRPAYSVHILIIPKKVVAGLAELDPDAEFSRVFLSDLLECVQSLVDELGLASLGYRLMVNGGKYQEVPQLHFHLISGE